MTMTLDHKFAASEDVVSREVSGEMVLLDLASGEYFGLDTVGSRVWELLSSKAQSLRELCDLIEAEFDAPRAVIEGDMIALASDLEKRELIVAAS